MVKTEFIPTKVDIRKKMSESRRALPESERVQFSRVIGENLEQLESYVQAKGILFFMSLDEEVQTTYLMEHAFQRGKTVYLPLVDRDLKEIRITRLPNLDIEFVNTRYGIKEPQKAHWNLVSPTEIDFVLVPGLAFNLTGGRVGFGTGYYDRLLHILDPKTFKVGVAFDFQLLQLLPQTSSDHKVQMIFTEKRTIACRQSLVEKG